MKKSIATIALFLITGSAILFAQDSNSFVLKLRNGTQKSILLSSVRKINFTDTDLLLNYRSGGADSYLRPSVRSLVFNGLSSGIVKAVATQPLMVYPSPADQFIAIKNLPDGDTKVTIFRQDGMTVLSAHIASSGEHIDVSALAKGFYFICVNDNVLKFVKR